MPPPPLPVFSDAALSALPKRSSGGSYDLSLDWLLNPTRARANIFAADEDGEALQQKIEGYEAEPLTKMKLLSVARQKELEDMWQHWENYATQVEFHPEQAWIDICLGREARAKPRFQTFLSWYVEKSVTLRPCLGSEEYEPVRTITSAATLEDIWADLVRVADMKVIQPQRQREPWNAQFRGISYSSRQPQNQNPTVIEIGRWIATDAERLGLRRDQTFEKQGLSTEDLLLLITSVWTRAPDIPCTASARLAFHTAVVLGGTGGWRPASLLGVKYQDLEIGHMRHPHNPEKVELVARIRIHHVKQQNNRIQRDQRDKLDFSITFVPCKSICLLSLLICRAIADNAFYKEYNTLEDILQSDPLGEGVDYRALKWRDDILGEKAIPLEYHQFLDIWNRVLLVIGMPKNPRLYAMRVGTAGKLNGQLTPAVRNYILSHSTDVYERSYHPVELAEDLMERSFGNLAQGNGELLAAMRRVCLKRDPNAPIYIKKADLEAFELRKDISMLREVQQDKSNPERVKKATGRIQHIINTLENLLIQKRRREYFEAMTDGKPTAHLVDRSAVNPRRKQNKASSIVAGHIAPFFMDCVLSQTLVRNLVAYLRNLPTEDDVEITEKIKPTPKKPRCLLCPNQEFHNKQSLSRHVWDIHAFNDSFCCPECHNVGRGQVTIKAGRPAWSNHVAQCHGKINVPNPISAKSAHCLLCSRNFTPNGFNAHFYGAHLDEVRRSFSCPECARCGQDSKTITSQDAWILHVRAVHGGPFGLQGAVIIDPHDRGTSSRLSTKRSREDETKNPYKKLKSNIELAPDVTESDSDLDSATFGLKPSGKELCVIGRDEGFRFTLLHD